MKKNDQIAATLCVSLLCLASVLQFIPKNKPILQTVFPAKVSEMEGYSVDNPLPQAKHPFDDKFVLPLPNIFSDKGFHLTISDHWFTGTIGIASVGELPPTNEGAFEEFYLPHN